MGAIGGFGGCCDAFREFAEQGISASNGLYLCEAPWFQGFGHSAWSAADEGGEAMTMEITIHKCLKCDWEWASRLLSRPKYCARCGRNDWWRPKVVKPQAVAVEHRERDTMAKYQISNLEVGQSTTFAWPKTAQETRDLPAGERMYRAILKQGQRSGRKYGLEGLPIGLRVTRVA